MSSTSPSRRDSLLETVRRLIAEHGLDGVTFREVAAAAGVSIGAVQYHFPSKDSILQAVMSDSIERIRQRSRDQIGTGPTRDRLFRALSEILPLDEDRLEESRIYLAFLARAAVSPTLTQLAHDVQAITRQGVRAGLEIAVRDGEAVRDLDLDRAAASTAALLDGLTAHLLTDSASMSPGLAEAILRDHLDTLLTPSR